MFAIVDFDRKTSEFFDTFAEAEQAIIEYNPQSNHGVVVVDLSEDGPQVETM